jgi:hypothetical protein
MLIDLTAPFRYCPANSRKDPDMKLSLTVLAATLISLTSYADKIKIDLDITQKYVASANVPNRFELSGGSVDMKVFAKVDGEKATQTKNVQLQADGSAILIGRDEITLIDKDQKQTIIPASISDGGQRVVYSETNASRYVNASAEGARIKVKASKTTCLRESTSVLTCNLSISAVASN